MNILSTSLLAADFCRLGQCIEEVDRAGSGYIHVDVMDGMFVPSISYGMPVMQSIRKITDKVFDVHLMIEEPIRYIEDFIKAGADIITVHVEACKDAGATLENIRACGVKAGLALNPETPVEALEPYLDKADMVLVMSVNPGFGGQSFIPSSLDKLRQLKKLLEQKKLAPDVEIDGGIHLGNLLEVLEAGANVIVAGSSIFKGDAAQNTKEFLKIMNR